MHGFVQNMNRLGFPEEVEESLMIIFIITSLATATFIPADKAISLACPFQYHNIVTRSNIVRGVISVWSVSLALATSIFFSTNHLGYQIVITILQIIFLLCSCCCHFYVYLVAHTHTKNISRTLQNQHASMQRLNSICGVRPSSPGARKDTILVFNGDTCLVYSDRQTTTAKSNHLEVIPQHQPFQQFDEGNKVERVQSRRSSFSGVSKPKRTLYLLLTPCCLLMAWIPHLIFSCYSIKQQTEVHLTETLPMNYQLSIQIPLLLLACFNPWLYHKLSLQQCFKDQRSGQCLDRTDHHQWQDSVSPSAGLHHSGLHHSGLQPQCPVSRPVSHASPEPSKDDLELVEMVKFLENQAKLVNSRTFSSFQNTEKNQPELSCVSL